jgi:hypothetical protein
VFPNVERDRPAPLFAARARPDLCSPLRLCGDRGLVAATTRIRDDAVNFNGRIATDGRLFGLNVGDWTLLVGGLALLAVLVLLI